MLGHRMVDRVTKPIRDTLGRDHVFGEPVRAGKRVVVPVARVAVGAGGGGRMGLGAMLRGRRVGAGAGGRSVPVGAIEIAPDGMKFVRFGARRHFALAAGAGVLLGLWLGRRRAS